MSTILRAVSCFEFGFIGLSGWVLAAGFSAKASTTTEADEMAYEYLSKMLMPFIVGFAIYSCHCQTHEGWYSMLLSTAVQTVYLMGFIVMTPQLFINYRMKSVSALPWRMLVYVQSNAVALEMCLRVTLQGDLLECGVRCGCRYRTLNTFIDDLFAFVIKMPTMHR